MQYILSEEEYSMLKGMSLRIEQLERENAELRQRRRDLRTLITKRESQINEMKRDMEGTRRALQLAKDKIQILQSRCGLKGFDFDIDYVRTHF